jgi:hypothetical protein
MEATRISEISQKKKADQMNDERRERNEDEYRRYIRRKIYRMRISFNLYGFHILLLHDPIRVVRLQSTIFREIPVDP